MLFGFESAGAELIFSPDKKTCQTHALITPAHPVAKKTRISEWDQKNSKRQKNGEKVRIRDVRGFLSLITLAVYLLYLVDV